MAFVFRRVGRLGVRPALVSSVLALAVVGLAGQTPPPAKPPATPPAAAPAAPPAGGQDRPADFSTRVDLVTTDVIARDNQGLFVADLRKDEFEVLEDGAPQTLVSFTLVLSLIHI